MSLSDEWLSAWDSKATLGIYGLTLQALSEQQTSLLQHLFQLPPSPQSTDHIQLKLELLERLCIF